MSARAKHGSSFSDLTDTGVAGVAAWTSGDQIIVDTTSELVLTAGQARQFADTLMRLADTVTP